MIETSNTSATSEQADELQNEVADFYTAESVTLDRPEMGHIRFYGRFKIDLSARYDDLRQRFERHGFTPFIRTEDGRESLIAVPVVFRPSVSNGLINIILLFATILSTLFIGAFIEFAIREIDGVPGFGDLWLGWPYSARLLTILGAHEVGH